MTFRKLAVLSVPLLVSITSCTVGPEYKPEEITPPQKFVTQDILDELSEPKSPDAESKISNWWEGFGDEQLNQIIEEAISNNYGIGQAAANLRRAERVVELAKAGDEPPLGATAGADASRSERIDDDQLTDNSESIFGSLGLVIPLDVFGRTKMRVERAEEGVDAARSDLRQAVLDVSSEIVNEYMSLRGNQRQLELLLESVELQEKTLSIVQARFDSGLAPELDVRRAETSVQRLYARIPPLNEDMVNSRNRIAVLSGQYPGAFEEVLSTQQQTPEYAAAIIDSVPLSILMRRPDIVAAEVSLKQAIKDIGIAEVEFYPEFEISADLTINTVASNASRTVDTIVASIAGTISQDILDGGARRANVEIAKAEAEEALLIYRQTLLEAFEEVEQSLASLQASRDIQSALEKAVQSSSRSFEQAETLYQQGLISFLDVVDAQRVLADAEQDLANERTNYATEIANLFLVLGTETEPVSREAVELPLTYERDEE